MARYVIDLKGRSWKGIEIACLVSNATADVSSFQENVLIPLRFLVSATALVVTLNSGVASAAPTIFFGENQNAGGSSVSGAPVTARNAFLAGLTSNVRNEGFESFVNNPVAPLDLTFTGSGGSSLGAKLTGAGAVFDTPAGGRFNTTPGGSHLFEVTGTFVIEFGTPISAFGFYGTDIGDFNGQLTIALTDASDAVTNVTVGNTVLGANGALLFWGFIDPTTAYKTITFGNTATGVDEFGFDDMVIGDRGQVAPPQPAPEPGSVALVGASLLALIAARRRNRQRF